MHQNTGRPKIVVLTQYYRPEPNFITADVANALARHFDVMVITAHPNYPTGRFYPGVRFWWPQVTQEDGVRVWRLPFIPDHSTSLLRRFVSYVSLLIMMCIIGPLVGGRPQIVWVYQTPFTTALAALWFKAVFRAKLIFTCADVWPESFTAAGVARPGILMDMLHAYSRWINRRADMIVCATRSTKARYAEDGIPLDRLCWIPVWVDGISEHLPSVVMPPTETPTIVYAGNLGPSQRLETLVQAAALLEQEGVQVQFDVYGTGSSEGTLRTLVHTLGVTTVSFHGRVSPAEAFARSSAAMAQVVSLRKAPLFRMTVPSKLYFCFATGAPILAGLEGESADLAVESEGAIVFDPESPQSLADAVKRVLALSSEQRYAMRMRLRQYYQRRFARARLLDAYLALMDRANQNEAPTGALPSQRHEWST